MSIVFPSFVPSQREFTLNNYPVKIYRTLSGAVAKRSFGNKPYSYRLDLEFTNVTDDVTFGILDHYEQTSAGFFRFSVPSSLFNGISDPLAGRMRSPSHILWEYESPPVLQSIHTGITAVSVRLIGELDVDAPAGGGAPVQFQTVSLIGDFSPTGVTTFDALGVWNYYDYTVTADTPPFCSPLRQTSFGGSNAGTIFGGLLGLEYSNENFAGSNIGDISLGPDCAESAYSAAGIKAVTDGPPINPATASYYIVGFSGDLNRIVSFTGTITFSTTETDATPASELTLSYA